ncbi:MAG: beta-ketoacyl synthase N-terminal-like domain-containing protein [Ignavibacteriota bacterium]
MASTGPTFTFSTACSSSAHALGHAFWMVRSGAAPVGHRRWR